MQWKNIRTTEVGVKSIYRLFKDDDLMTGHMNEVGQIEPHEYLNGTYRAFINEGREVRETSPI